MNITKYMNIENFFAFRQNKIDRCARSILNKFILEPLISFQKNVNNVMNIQCGMCFADLNGQKVTDFLNLGTMHIWIFLPINVSKSFGIKTTANHWILMIDKSNINLVADGTVIKYHRWCHLHLLTDLSFRNST